LLAGIGAVTLVSFLKETPKYLLITRGNHQGALASLQFYRGKDEANEAVIENIQKEAQAGYEAPFLKSIPIVIRTPHLRQAYFVGFCALQIGSFVFIACNFIASIFGALAVDRFGRRPLLLSFALCNTLSLCAYCVFDRIAFYVDEQFKYGCIASLIAYGITFGISIMGSRD
uniref:MFS domain-containing protein n=1 Tax=Anisakis simplex TaxID=6269 RepID=A0A0M3J4N1_ANISI